MIWINERLRSMREDKGFTLIELMVVVLIIAILIAIAIPTFLGARERAQRRAAQSSLRNTVTAAKAAFTDNSSYTGVDETALTPAEPAIEFVGSAAISDATNKVSVLVVSSTVFRATQWSQSNECYAIQDKAVSGANSGTRWFKFASVNGAGCNAAAAGLPAEGDAAWTKAPT